VCWKSKIIRPSLDKNGPGGRHSDLGFSQEDSLKLTARKDGVGGRGHELAEVPPKEGACDRRLEETSSKTHCKCNFMDTSV